MKRKIIGLTFMVAVLGYLSFLSISTSATGKQNITQKDKATPAACSLKSKLPSTFFLKTSLDCTPCCNESEQVYQSCLRRRDKEVCDCAALAYSTCLDGGCGPCNCCHNWYLFGYGYGCWTSAGSEREKGKQQ